MNKRKKLVILPGWSNDGSRMWQYQIQHLSPQYDIETIVVSNQVTPSNMADEVLQRSPQNFILLGHSLGGLIAQHAAIKAPERVHCLILVGTFPGNVSDDQRIFYEQKMLHPLLEGTIAEYWPALNQACVAPRRVNDQTLLEALAICQGLSTEGLINQTKVLINAQDISTQLSTLTMPTLIIYGKEDQLFTIETQKLMLNKLPNATLEVIEDCGHIPSLEQSQAITTILISWLNQFKES